MTGVDIIGSPSWRATIARLLTCIKSALELWPMLVEICFFKNPSHAFPCEKSAAL
jgi:hypothetical protein